MKKTISSNAMLSLVLLSACQVPVNTNNPSGATPNYIFQPQSGLPNDLGQAEDSTVETSAESAVTATTTLANSQSPANTVVNTTKTANSVKASSNPIVKASPTASPVTKTLISKDGNLLIPISSIQVSKEFDYASTQDISVQISVNNPNGEPYKQVLVAIYALDSSGLKPIASGVTNQQGLYTDLICIPGYHDELNIQVSGFGIDNAKTVSIQNKSVQAHFGK